MSDTEQRQKSQEEFDAPDHEVRASCIDVHVSTPHDFIEPEPRSHTMRCTRCGTERRKDRDLTGLHVLYRAPCETSFGATDPTCDGALKLVNDARERKLSALREFACEIINTIDDARNSGTSWLDVERAVVELLERGPCGS